VHVGQEAKEPETFPNEHNEIPVEVQHHDKAQTSTHDGPTHEPQGGASVNDLEQQMEVKEELVVPKEAFGVETANTAEHTPNPHVDATQEVSHPNDQAENIHKTVEENAASPALESGEIDKQTKQDIINELETIEACFNETPSEHTSNDQVHSEVHLPEVTEHGAPSTTTEKSRDQFGSEVREW